MDGTLAAQAKRPATGRLFGRNCARTLRRCPPRHRRSRREDRRSRLLSVHLSPSPAGPLLPLRTRGLAVAALFAASARVLPFVSSLRAEPLKQLGGAARSANQRSDVSFCPFQRLHHRHPPQWAIAEIEHNRVPVRRGDLRREAFQAFASEVGARRYWGVRYGFFNVGHFYEALHVEAREQRLLWAKIVVLQIECLDPVIVHAALMPFPVSLNQLELRHPIERPAKR